MGSQLVAECEITGDNYILNWAYWSVAYYLMICGALREARQWVTKLIESGEARKDQRALGMAYWTLSWIEICARDYERAETNADRALEIAAAPYDRNAASQVRAVALLLQGRLEEGVATMRTTRDWALKTAGSIQRTAATCRWPLRWRLAAIFAAGSRCSSRASLPPTPMGAGNSPPGTAFFSLNSISPRPTASIGPPSAVILRNLRTIVGLTLSRHEASARAADQTERE